MTDAKTLADKLRWLADCDARAGAPLGQRMRKAADLIERQAAELAALQDAARINMENYEFQRNKADRATATVYQFHYAMKDAGWHPGRTNDNLCDIIREKGKELAALRASTASVQADQRAELDRLLAENAKLKTVMVAAAEEMAAHWDAHCDAEGYGPVNLQRRLEEGIASEYGYTAGAFEKLRVENEALRNALKVAGGALRYHQEQTRPIHSTNAAIKTIDTAIAGRESLVPGKRGGVHQIAISTEAVTRLLSGNPTRLALKHRLQAIEVIIQQSRDLFPWPALQQSLEVDAQRVRDALAQANSEPRKASAASTSRGSMSRAGPSNI